MINNNISNPRNTYSLKELSEESVSSNPIEQFTIWMNEAIESKLLEPNAMILATASKKGIPSARTVLLKGFDEKGFVFYTNYKSSKARDLDENPNAALLFLWAELERQIRISGKVVQVSREVSEHYFHSRPREHQLGTWASWQSRVLENRNELEKRFEEMKKRFEDKEIPLPPFWGGYQVIPQRIEFWQGRESRLHDRICYTLIDGKWKIERLSP